VNIRHEEAASPAASATRRYTNSELRLSLGCNKAARMRQKMVLILNGNPSFHRFERKRQLAFRKESPPVWRAQVREETLITERAQSLRDSMTDRKFV
jgi:hypothetical protein